jgi:predicted RNA-binding Zn-ribbon protein involved in translation (DUF1610 family)
VGFHLTQVYAMSESISVKGFNNRTTQIACPKCSYVTKQQCSKLRKNITLICPNCGTQFTPKQG